jgi:hypothetical protein
MSVVSEHLHPLERALTLSTTSVGTTVRAISRLRERDLSSAAAVDLR